MRTWDAFVLVHRHGSIVDGLIGAIVLLVEVVNTV